MIFLLTTVICQKGPRHKYQINLSTTTCKLHVTPLQFLVLRKAQQQISNKVAFRRLLLHSLCWKHTHEGSSIRIKESRDFNPQWYKTYPWITFDAEHCHFVCFACREFMGDKTFTFDNWKKSNRLKKHAKSVVHKDAMTKWIGSKINAKHKTSVLKQLTESQPWVFAHNHYQYTL